MMTAAAPGAHSAVSPGPMIRMGVAATGAANVSTATSFVCWPASSA
jgi:hypothetical protein